MQAKLIVIGGKTSVQEIPLKPTTRVGRRRDSDICISSALVSRDHCVIFQRQDQWVVRDLGSTNGTVVNGASVKEQVLQPGDQLLIGPVQFEVRCPASAASAAVSAKRDAAAEESDVLRLADESGLLDAEVVDAEVLDEDVVEAELVNEASDDTTIPTDVDTRPASPPRRQKPAEAKPSAPRQPPQSRPTAKGPQPKSQPQPPAPEDDQLDEFLSGLDDDSYQVS